LSLIATLLAVFPAVAFAQASLPVPPTGYDQSRSGVPEGMVSSISYPTTNHGMRPARVYTPPSYSTATDYPVLYLHHGLGGDETSWTDGASAHIILDNLLADGLATPMIIVMPNNSMTSSNAVIIPDLNPRAGTTATAPVRSLDRGRGRRHSSSSRRLPQSSCAEREHGRRDEALRVATRL
jgi:enterochelin esterase-like enzyme